MVCELRRFPNCYNCNRAFASSFCFFQLKKKVEDTRILNKQKKSTHNPDDFPSLEKILSAGLERGLTTADAETFDLGMWVDFVIEYNNVHCEDKYKVHYATQSDFDAL